MSLENRKIFPPHVVCGDTKKSFPLELGMGTGCHNTRITGRGYQVEKEVLRISSAIWIQYMNVTDRRTDIGRQQRPHL